MIRSIIGGLSALLALAGAAAAADDALEARLAAASATEGEKVFRKCKACHTIEEGGANRVGPNLWGVVGRAVASAEDFRYSDAMGGLGGVWTPERLDAFLERPRSAVKGTKMTFAGIRDAKQRADLIAYLDAHGPSPTLADGDAGSEQAESEGEDENDFGVLVAGPGAEETYAYCTACHSEMIVAQQGMTRERWAKLFEWMVEEQGMAEIEQPDRGAVLDYLAANYGPDRPNFPRP